METDCRVLREWMMMGMVFTDEDSFGAQPGTLGWINDLVNDDDEDGLVDEDDVNQEYYAPLDDPEQTAYLQPGRNIS